MKGQRGAILNHLKTYGSITSMEAYDKYGATRLSAVIFDLRHMGYNIKSIRMKTKTRYDVVTSYAKYVLEESEEK